MKLETQIRKQALSAPPIPGKADTPHPAGEVNRQVPAEPHPALTAPARIAVPVPKATDSIPTENQITGPPLLFTALFKCPVMNTKHYTGMRRGF